MYGQDTLSTPTISDWHKRLPDGREDVENNK
jgi:hypothetical protein